MKIALCLTLLLLAPVASAATLEDKISKILPLLESDDFDVREQATRSLTDLGEEAVEAIARLYKAETQPESKWRLMAAVKGIYLERVLPKDPRYRKLHADAGFEVYAEYDYNAHGMGPIESDQEGHQYMRREPKLVGLRLSGDGLGGAEALKNGDTITHVNGAEVTDGFEPMAGEEYEFAVTRKTTKEAEGGGYTENSENLKVRVRVGWKEEQFLSDHTRTQLATLRLEAWREYSKRTFETSSK